MNSDVFHCMYQPNPSTLGSKKHKENFKEQYEWLPYQDLKSPVCLSMYA